jgi:hypothetical protein
MPKRRIDFKGASLYYQIAEKIRLEGEAPSRIKEAPSTNGETVYRHIGKRTLAGT